MRLSLTVIRLEWGVSSICNVFVFSELPMSKMSRLVLPLLVSYFSFAGVAQALPNMRSDEVVEWFKSNRSVAPLRPTQKYEAGMSDFDSSTQVKDGSFQLSVFLDAQDKVEVEVIDYRPKCWFSRSSECSGTVRFEKANRSSGQNLIKTVWGQEVLDDFKSSKLMETLSSPNGTNRWYQGKIYNYETYHYINNTIVHFAVVSKKDDQGARIREYIRCEKSSACDL
jgi:hypothetical protein